MEWVKDNDPYGPALVLKCFGFHGEVFKNNSKWDFMVTYIDEYGRKIEVPGDMFKTQKEAKEFVENRLKSYLSTIDSYWKKI